MVEHMDKTMRFLWLCARGMEPAAATSALEMIERLSKCNELPFCVRVNTTGRYIGQAYISSIGESADSMPLWKRETYLNINTRMHTVRDRWNEAFDITRLPTPVTGEQL